MLYIRIEHGVAVDVSTKLPEDLTAWANNQNGWLSRDHITSYEMAVDISRQLTECLGRTFLPIDATDAAWPRYGIIEAPKIGDKVSRSFNGDSYPCGEIIKITPTWQITTSTGQKFRRIKNSGGWREAGRSFWMVAGHIDERNPHF